jgi:hypothetical protein
VYTVIQAQENCFYMFYLIYFHFQRMLATVSEIVSKPELLNFSSVHLQGPPQSRLVHSSCSGPNPGSHLWLLSFPPFHLSVNFVALPGKAPDHHISDHLFSVLLTSGPDPTMGPTSPSAMTLLKHAMSSLCSKLSSTAHPAQSEIQHLIMA